MAQGSEPPIIDADYEVISGPAPVEYEPLPKRRYNWPKIVWQTYVWCGCLAMAITMLFMVFGPKAPPHDPCDLPPLPVKGAHPGDPDAYTKVLGCEGHIPGPPRPLRTLK